MEFKEAKRKDASRNPVVLAVINQKGGVGKSTTAVNLAAALGEKKYKVLLVDLDAQGNATTGVGYDKTQCEISTYNCLVDDDVKTEDAISEIKTKNVWLLPATIDLAGAETKLVDEIARECCDWSSDVCSSDVRPINSSFLFNVSFMRLKDCQKSSIQ